MSNKRTKAKLVTDWQTLEDGVIELIRSSQIPPWKGLFWVLFPPLEVRKALMQAAVMRKLEKAA